MPTVIPTDQGVLLISPASATDVELAESAALLKTQIRLLKDALEDHTAVLRQRITERNRQSGKFGEIQITLKPQYAVVCACHMYDVRQCENIGVREIEVKKVEVARYVDIEDQRSPALEHESKPRPVRSQRSASVEGPSR